MERSAVQKVRIEKKLRGREFLLPFLQLGDSPSAFPKEQNQLLNSLLAELQTITGWCGPDRSLPMTHLPGQERQESSSLDDLNIENNASLLG